MSDDQQDVSLGELHRVCLRIEEQVKLTNSRVQKAENRLTRLETITGLVGGALTAATGWLGMTK